MIASLSTGRWAKSMSLAPPVSTLVQSLWRPELPQLVDQEQLLLALPWARVNRVEGSLLRRYPVLLPSGLAAVEANNESFRSNLAGAATVLRAAGVDVLLVKTDLSRDFEYSNFDLVVGDDGWSRALIALRPWGNHTTRYWLEHSKLIFYPPTGPGAHLHRNLNWFDIPLFNTQRLRDRSLPGPTEALRIPGPSDEVRSLLAHALFQNLTLDFADLLRLREILTPGVTADAQVEASQEGWAAGFRGSMQLVHQAIQTLDAGGSIPLPLPLPIVLSVQGGLEHARHLAGVRRLGKAAREVVLRGPLVGRRLVWGRAC